MGIKKKVAKQVIEKEIGDKIVKPKKPRSKKKIQVGIPKIQDEVPVAFQEFDDELEQRFGMCLKQIEYQGQPEDRKYTFFEKVFRNKKNVKRREERWKFLTAIYNEAVDMIYSPIYIKKEYIDALKVHINELYNTYKDERVAVKQNLDSAGTFQQLKGVVGGLKISEEKRKELEKLYRLYIDLFDEDKAFNSLSAEYEGRYLPFSIRDDGFDYKDPAIVKHQLIYAKSFAPHFFQHSNSSLWRLHTDLIDLIQEILAELRHVNRAQRPYETTRNMPGFKSLAKTVIDMYYTQRGILRERRYCLAYHKHIVYSMMYERLNCFLIDVEQDKDLFVKFYGAVRDYITLQIQAQPEIREFIEKNSDKINQKVVHQLVFAWGQKENGGQGEYRQPKQIVAEGYCQFISKYNRLSGTPLMSFNLQMDGYQIDIQRNDKSIVSEDYCNCVEVYFNSCHHAIEDPQFKVELEGLSFEECNLKINVVCQNIRHQMEEDIDYGGDFVRALEGYLDVFLALGKQVNTVRLIKEMAQDTPWLSLTEKQYYTDLGVVEIFYELELWELAELYELQTRFNYRFSKQQLLNDLANLLVCDAVNDDLQIRIKYYLDTLLKLDEMNNILKDNEKQSIKLLNRIVSGDLDETDLEVPIFQDRVLVGFRSFECLSHLFPQQSGGKLGKGFSARCIELYVKQVLDRELEQTLESIRQRNADGAQIKRMQVYFRVFKTYFPNDETIVKIYMQKVIKAKDYFRGLFSCQIGLETDMTEERVQNTIVLNYQYINMLDSSSDSLKKNISSYLQRFTGNNTQYYMLIHLLNDPYEDPDTKERVDPMLGYSEKIFSFLLELNGISLVDAENWKDPFVTYFDSLFQYDNYPHVVACFQEKLAQMIANENIKWSIAAQVFIDKYGNLSNKTEYHIKGFNYFLSLNQENRTADYIGYLKQADINGNNFVMNAEQMRRLEKLVDNAILKQYYSKSSFSNTVALKNFSKSSLQKLTDSFLPSRQIQVRLERLKILIKLCLSFAKENNDICMYPVVKEFIQYFSQQKKHYDGMVLTRSCFAYAELTMMTPVQFDGCFIPDGQESLDELKPIQVELLFNDRKKQYAQHCMNQVKSIFSSAIFDGSAWSSHVLWLLINFGIQQDIKNYFILGLNNILNINDIDAALQWENSLEEIGVNDIPMKKIRQSWQQEAEGIVQNHISLNSCSLSTLIIINGCQLIIEQQRFYRKRLTEIFTGETSKFWENEGYDELKIYLHAFGIEPVVEDKELIEQQLQNLFGSHQLDLMDDLVQAIEKYLATEMTNASANILLGKVGLISFMPKKIKDIFTVKKGKEEDLHHFKRILGMKDFIGCERLYTKFHQQLTDAESEHSVIVSACQDLINHTELLLIQEMARTAILQQILLRAKNTDCYFLEQFDDDARQEIGRIIIKEKQKEAEAEADKELTESMEETQQQYLQECYEYLAEKKIIESLQKKHKRKPTKEEIEKQFLKSEKKKNLAKAKLQAVKKQKKKIKKREEYESQLLEKNNAMIRGKHAQKLFYRLLMKKIIEQANIECPHRLVESYDDALAQLMAEKNLTTPEIFQLVYSQRIQFYNIESYSEAYQDPNLYHNLRIFLADEHWRKSEGEKPTTKEEVDRRVKQYKKQYCANLTRGDFIISLRKVCLDKNKDCLKSLISNIVAHEKFSKDNLSILVFWQKLGEHNEKLSFPVAMEFRELLGKMSYSSECWTEQLALINYHGLFDYFKGVLEHCGLTQQFQKLPEVKQHPTLPIFSFEGLQFKVKRRRIQRASSVRRLSSSAPRSILLFHTPSASTTNGVYRGSPLKISHFSGNTPSSIEFPVKLI